MVETYYIDRSQNIGDLRRSSEEPLSRPDFNNIRWIGVFGSFARGEQHDRSDVDIIVIEKFNTEDVALPSGSWTLEDLLPRVWCRPIDVIRISKRELRGWVSVHALLTSRTLYGDDRSKDVLELRQDAQECLEGGKAIFRKVDDDIKALRTKVDGINMEDFMNSPETRDGIRNDLLGILIPLDIQPTWHPIHEGFWSAIIQQAVEMKRIVAAKSEDPKYWTQIWDIVAKPLPQSTQGLAMLALRLERLVFPSFKEIDERINLAKDLDKEDLKRPPPVKMGVFRTVASKTNEYVRSCRSQFRMDFCFGRSELPCKDE